MPFAKYARKLMWIVVMCSARVLVIIGQFKNEHALGDAPAV
jgi:hypothetical protein